MEIESINGLLDFIFGDTFKSEAKNESDERTKRILYIVIGAVLIFLINKWKD